MAAAATFTKTVTQEIKENLEKLKTQVTEAGVKVGTGVASGYKGVTGTVYSPFTKILGFITTNIKTLGENVGVMIGIISSGATLTYLGPLIVDLIKATLAGAGSIALSAPLYTAIVTLLLIRYKGNLTDIKNKISVDLEGLMVFMKDNLPGLGDAVYDKIKAFLAALGTKLSAKYAEMSGKVADADEEFANAYNLFGADMTTQDVIDQIREDPDSTNLLKLIVDRIPKRFVSGITVKSGFDTAPDTHEQRDTRHGVIESSQEPIYDTLWDREEEWGERATYAPSLGSPKTAPPALGLSVVDTEVANVLPVGATAAYSSPSSSPRSHGTTAAITGLGEGLGGEGLGLGMIVESEEEEEIPESPKKGKKRKSSRSSRSSRSKKAKTGGVRKRTKKNKKHSKKSKKSTRKPRKINKKRKTTRKRKRKRSRR